MPTCAEGHDTEATDYCDVCGSPVTARTTQPTSSSAATTVCPACNAPISGRFCEACGHDSALPEPAAAAAAPQSTEAAVSVEWTATVTADREYYKRVIARGGPDTVVATADGVLQPVLGLYAPAALDLLRAAPPGAPLTRTVEALEPVRVALPAALVRSVNTPEDLAEAEAQLA